MNIHVMVVHVLNLALPLLCVHAHLLVYPCVILSLHMPALLVPRLVLLSLLVLALALLV